MKLSSITVSILFLVMACQNSGNKANQLTPDPELMDQLTGMYSGVLPCEDCPGIQYYLVLRENYEFETNARYMGKPSPPDHYYGSWSMQTDSIIFLDKARSDMQYFKISGERLIMLDASGQERQTEDADNYILIRMKDEPPPPREDNAVETSRRKGFDFTASGSTPEWSINVTFNAWTKFRADTISLITPSPRKVASPDPEIMMYAVPTTLGELTMRIREEPCRDPLTGREHPYTVDVQLYKTKYTGCGTLLTEFPADTLK